MVMVPTTPETAMKLYYFETPNSRKVCATAKHLNSPVEWIRIDLAKQEHKTPEFLAFNPNGKVPALVDGDAQIWESMAIMCYLAEKAGSDLWPSDARQIDVIRWLSWDIAHFSRHAGTLFFQHVIKANFGMGPPDDAAVKEALGFFRHFAAVLNTHLESRSYLVGDALTIADFAVASILPVAEPAKIPVSEFPAIERWHARLEELPAWQEPFPAH